MWASRRERSSSFIFGYAAQDGLEGQSGDGRDVALVEPEPKLDEEEEAYVEAESDEDALEGRRSCDREWG